jgi:hypothetical protein
MRLSLRRYQFIPMNSAEEARVVPIVGDAAIATVGIGHGRLTEAAKYTPLLRPTAL